MITAPGIFPNVSALEYHADCCATPSLSSSIAKKIVNESPMHAWISHPRLGGAPADGDEDATDPTATKQKALGELTHRLMFNKGADVVVIDADSYRTALAKAQRDAALAKGKIAVLAHKLPEAQAAVDSARKQLDDMGYDYAYRDGMMEVVLVWQEPGGVWMRSMMDQLLIDENSKTAIIRDLKTVSRSSHPTACATQISKMAYDLSAAFYLRGLATLRPDLAGRIKFEFDFMEVNPPYAVTPVTISAEWLMAAEFRCEKAIALWRRCVSENKWPYYTNHLVRLEPKIWDIADMMAVNDE